MGWIKSNAPQDHTQAYWDGLPDFVSTGTPLWSSLRGKSDAYEVYGLSQDKLRENFRKLTEEDSKKLKKDLLKQLGWRFVAAGSGQVGACHVGGVNGRTPKLTGFSSSQQIADAVNYLKHFEACPEIALGDFTVRILRVPWLRFEAFWLSSSNATEDLVIPYAGFPSCADLELLTIYPVAEFLEKVSKHTERFKPSAHQQEADARRFHVQRLLNEAARNALAKKYP